MNSNICKQRVILPFYYHTTILLLLSLACPPLAGVPGVACQGGRRKSSLEKPSGCGYVSEPIRPESDQSSSF